MLIPSATEPIQDEINPFHVPQNNADIIRLREAEKLRRTQARELNHKLKIWQKGKSLHRNFHIQGEPRLEKKEGVEDIKLEDKSKKIHDRIEKAIDSCMSCHIEEKECMATFIAKKREMFLLQMSLNIKRNEIHKIEERARLKEEALKRSELMLEEDGIRFDEFLKENDKKAQNAIRKAELETKIKLDKVQEIKKINHSIQAVQAEITKDSEVLLECLKYKNFFDALTPSEWIEEEKKKKLDRQKKRRQKRIEKRKEKWREQEEEKLARVQAEAKSKGGRDKQRRRKEIRTKQNEELIVPTLPPEPDFEDEVLTSSGDDIPMYFKEPQQFLEIFSGLEEDNLFLIQNKQESEHALAEMKRHNMQIENDMSEKVTSLERNMQELRALIEEEKKKSNLHIERIQSAARNNVINSTTKNENGNTHSDIFMNLGQKVKEVYSRCGFDDSGTTPTTLFMLSELEAKMGDLLMEINELPEKLVRKEMKDKEKKRREIKRLRKLEAQQRAQDERNRKALERSMQPPIKRTTKPVMFRSQPIKQKKKEVTKQITEEEMDEIRYLT